MRCRPCSRRVFAVALLLSAPALSVAGLLAFVQPQSTLDTVREAETNSVSCFADANASRFRIRLVVNGNDYNCAMLEFGVDESGNGLLDRNETDLSIGWDCGEWVCCNRRTGVVSCASRAAGSRSLELLVYLRGDGTPYRFEAKDGGPVFQDIPVNALFSQTWNLARLVTRGGTPLESASVKHFPAPFVITLR